MTTEREQQARLILEASTGMHGPVAKQLAERATAYKATSRYSDTVSDGGMDPRNGDDAKMRREIAAWKWGYAYLQDRMRSLDRHGWAHDCDDEIEQRINGRTE
jgi:hypothetical protein